VTALKLRSDRQAADQDQANGAWVETGLVFTTRHGTPMEIYTEVPSAATREALRKLGQWLDDARAPDRHNA